MNSERGKEKMKYCKNFGRSFIALILCLAVIASLPVFSFAEEKEPIATLVFASDYQYDVNHSPGTLFSTIRKIFPNVKAANPSVDKVVFCGDYTNTGSYNYNENAASTIETLKKRVSSYLSSTAGTVFLQGNHDMYDSSLMAPDGAIEEENYIIYVMNTQSANPWCQGTVAGSEAKVKAAAADLKAYLDGLIEKGDTRPVIVATHVPLHMSPRTSKLEDSRTGDNKYSSYFFNVLNEAGKALDIFYVYGHNHANGYDSYLGGSCVFLAPGDTIAIPDVTGITTTYTNKFNLETLNFTYMNAGFIGYNAGSTADDTLTMSVMNIYKDRIEVSRYSADGAHDVGAAGAYNTVARDGRLDDSKGYANDDKTEFYIYPLAKAKAGTATVARRAVSTELYGLAEDGKGDIRYYENGTPVAKGLVKDSDGNYYFINSTKKAVKNCEYTISAANTNGLLAAGKYTFDENGKIANLEIKNGIVLDSDGELRFYRFGTAVAEGVAKDSDGNYYFFNGSKKAVKNCEYSFSEEAGNGLLAAGKYTFGEDGRILDVTVKTGFGDRNEGELHFYGNGDICYFAYGAKVAIGLVFDEDDGSYYFINSTKKAVRNCEYSFNEKMSNGLLPAGKYSFGEDGRLIIKEGLSFDADGEIRYYENNQPVAKGLVTDSEGNYYFINSTKKAVKNCDYAFSEARANGLLAAGKYTFGADGKLVA